jgi:hypothetical protein
MPLVACKRCGRYPIVVGGFNEIERWSVYCISDSCHTSNARTFKSEREAIEAWNNQNIGVKNEREADRN